MGYALTIALLAPASFALTIVGVWMFVAENDDDEIACRLVGGLALVVSWLSAGIIGVIVAHVGQLTALAGVR